ncbi:hypothetical protein XI09_00980 [Bradyrhizobium sp. CCBAU 11386]|uniref:hypothetical protein n=1 Tax=Bradyrhizobium sp. CCBAU 11386 TaxID=1630837 RepID=UPI0023023452|nr:hypothetical protein [Bradyrhizobium sp. CCBAU 11386]MDA9503439.1 hypothetical protein [Bradyrhizobium sp. CCBAU 11386]
MWELIHTKHNSISAGQELAQMREELINIGEKERILKERNADREAYRYLLDAHRLFAREGFSDEELLNICPPGADEGSQLAA